MISMFSIGIMVGGNKSLSLFYNKEACSYKLTDWSIYVFSCSYFIKNYSNYNIHNKVKNNINYIFEKINRYGFKYRINNNSFGIMLYIANTDANNYKGYFI